MSTTPTLLVVGSGPSIGVSTASLFASRKFNKVALIARDPERIKQDRESVLQNAIQAGRNVEVKIWSVDITETIAFQKTLKEIEDFGSVSCVLFKAARVGMSKLLEFDESEILKDFMVNNIALYTTAKWAIPILSKESDKSSFFVTNSMLWISPIPQMFSLSMAKAAQRNLVLSLHETYPQVHIALLNVGGAVSKEDKNLNPDAIAEKFWELYSQEEGQWSFELDVLG